ncbi:HD domain-containing protein [Jimgerdemannia flammicorona]|uniref:HD domain-containing protein n=1 Tax=Jimgerdemannia flammicorona TaxID=994334 RepID=A0A433QAK3_9FUNG|nr:HD domain-containing protein [Jimgerdemannia flammicorona]
MSVTEAQRFILFFIIVSNLKHIDRTGWVRYGITDVESVADHMYRIAVMAMVAGDTLLDVGKCVQLAIIYDLAESIVGDITLHDNMSVVDKHNLE